MRLLIEAKAPLDGRDTSFQTPLLLADIAGQPSIVDALLHAGARDSRLTEATLAAAIDGHDAEFRRLVEIARAPLDGKDPEGLTCLHHASRAAKFEMVVLCLENDADPLALSESGALPLHYACGSGCVEAVKRLVNIGSSVEAADRTGATPLHYAACGGHHEVFITLIVIEIYLVMPFISSVVIEISLTVLLVL